MKNEKIFPNLIETYETIKHIINKKKIKNFNKSKNVLSIYYLYLFSIVNTR